MTSWTPKVDGTDVVSASHINLLQTEKLDWDDSRLGYVTPEMYGAAGDGITDDTDAIQAAVTACPARTHLMFDHDYLIVSAITISAKTSLKISGRGTITQTTDNASVFKLTGDCSRIEINGLKLVGPHTVGDAYAGGGAAIQIGGIGGDGGSAKNDIIVTKCRINGFTWAGIMCYANQSGATVPHINDVIISHNIIDDCQNGVFFYKNISRATISDNIFTNCWGNSIALDTMADTDAETTQANYNITISANISYRCGSYSSGCGVLLKGDNSNISIVGNSIYETGKNMRSDGWGTGIRLCNDTSNAVPSYVTISGNTIKSTDGYGTLDALSYGIDIGSIGTTLGPKYITVSGNAVSGTEGYGIIVSQANNVVISGNSFYNCNDAGVANFITGTATYPSTYIAFVGNSVEQATSGGNAVYLSYAKYINIDSNQFINYLVPIAGDGNAVGKSENNVIDKQTAAVSTSGTGEDNLYSTTIWQNIYKQYRGVRFRAGGSITGANGNKTIKFYIGTAAYTVIGPVNNQNDWYLNGEFLFADSSTEQCIWSAGNLATYNSGYEVTTQNNATGNITLKITGECANASDIIYQRYWEVEIF